MKSKKRLIFRADRAVFANDEQPVTVVVEDQRIQAIGPKNMLVEGDEEIILKDDEVLLPGIVDSHVHVNEPGRTQWEGYETATRAAACGGITTVLDMPLNSSPPTTTVEALEQKMQATSGKLSVDVGFWGGAVPDNMGQLKPLWDRGVFGFKCFTAHSGIDEYGFLAYEQILRDMRDLAEIDGLMIVHAEDPSVLAGAPQPLRADRRKYEGYLKSRPKEAENEAIRQIIEAAKITKARVHLLHLASAEALPLIRKAKDQGVRITVETCPHYLTFAAETIPDGATEYKCAPPLRDENNRRGLWEGLKDGTIDHIASDHSPCIVELKCRDTGDFSQAWGGVASVQLGLPAVWTAGQEFGATLPEIANWFAAAPCRNFNIEGRGSIAVGNYADFAIFAPDEEFVVDVHKLEHRNKISPYDRRRMRGVVRETRLRGKRVTRESRLGEIITRS